MQALYVNSFYFTDYSLQWLLIIAASFISIIASTLVNGAYKKYSKQPSLCRKTGADVARSILQANGIFDVEIEKSQGGTLSDHFDPKAKTIRLSSGIYDGTSIASLAVAAHEVGHALQYAQNYIPIKVRNIILPVANIGSSLAFPIILLGIFLGGIEPLINAGIILFLAVLAFQLITLPVEFNASNRALRALNDNGYLVDNESRGAKKVLSAAAGTYVASLLASVLTLLRLLLLSKRSNR